MGADWWLDASVGIVGDFPTRMDFAIVALDIVLRAIDQKPEHDLVQLLRNAIEDELAKADFDQEQIRIRLGNMIEDCEEDLDKWRHCHKWLREHKALVAKAQAIDGSGT